MEMICPKAQNKTCEFNEECNSHNKPHKFNRDECFLPEDGCPACIEYKSEPTYRLVKLPSIETIENPYTLKAGEVGITDPFSPRIMAKNHFNDGIESVYASAKPVGIEALAEKIWRAVPEYTGHYNLTKIKQAIEDYIKE